jgi:hypothetical protein
MSKNELNRYFPAMFGAGCDLPKTPCPGVPTTNLRASAASLNVVVLETPALAKNRSDFVKVKLGRAETLNWLRDASFKGTPGYVALMDDLSVLVRWQPGRVIMDLQLRLCPVQPEAVQPSPLTQQIQDLLTLGDVSTPSIVTPAVATEPTDGTAPGAPD